MLTSATALCLVYCYYRTIPPITECTYLSYFSWWGYFFCHCYILMGIYISLWREIGCCHWYSCCSRQCHTFNGFQWGLPVSFLYWNICLRVYMIFQCWWVAICCRTHSLWTGCLEESSICWLCVLIDWSPNNPYLHSCSSLWLPLWLLHVHWHLHLCSIYFSISVIYGKNAPYCYSYEKSSMSCPFHFYNLLARISLFRPQNYALTCTQNCNFAVVCV